MNRKVLHIGIMPYQDYKTRSLAIARGEYRPILLAPGQAKGDIPSDPRWRVIPNETVEVEF